MSEVAATPTPGNPAQANQTQPAEAKTQEREYGWKGAPKALRRGAIDPKNDPIREKHEAREAERVKERNKAYGLVDDEDREESAETKEGAGQNEEAEREAAPKEEPRKFKVKVDGQDLEVDEDELRRGYSHGKAAARRMEQATREAQKAQRIMKALQSEETLFQALTELGHDPFKLAEKHLGEVLHKKTMDPKDLELEELRSFRQKIEQERNDEAERIKQQRFEEAKQRHAKTYTDEFMKVLTETKLPPTKGNVARVGSYIKQAAVEGWKLSTQEAALLVKQDLEQENLALISESDGDALLNLLGDEKIEKILQARAAKVKNPEQNLKTPPPSAEAYRRPSKSGPMSPREWKRFNRR